MKTRDFSFNLPEELIAQNPPAQRGDSRLFILNPSAPPGTGEGYRWDHRKVSELVEIIEPGTVMVFNNSKVRRARIEGATAQGGRVEALLLENRGEGTWACLTNRSKKLKTGDMLTFPGGMRAQVGERDEDLRLLHFKPSLDESYLELWGHIPLPPYMKRPDNDSDRNRYQTVYAGPLGSAAAPTAGLHFTPELLGALEKKGVEIRFVTLHVGLGTFLPVRVENLENHRMHREIYSIPQETADSVNKAKVEGRKILSVGTTSLRTLESAWVKENEWGKGHLPPGDGETSIFIYPGYDFSCVEQLFTNFHTPESTLLMLVSAFAGKDHILKAYQEAVDQRYRFFSYGDSMLILTRKLSTEHQ